MTNKKITKINQTKIKKNIKKIVVLLLLLLFLVTGVWATSRDDNGVGISLESISSLKWLPRLNNNWKNQSVGCCLPYCGEANQTECEQLGGDSWVNRDCPKLRECKKGCCILDCKVLELSQSSCESMDGSWNKNGCDLGCCEIEAGFYEPLPEKLCNQCTSGRWKEGNQYYTLLKTEGSKSFVQNTGLWEMSVSLKNCSQDPLNSKWYGAWQWEWFLEQDMNKFKADGASELISFETVKGQAEFVIGNLPARAVISNNRIQIEFFMSYLGENIILEGDIKKGLMPEELEIKIKQDVDKKM